MRKQLVPALVAFVFFTVLVGVAYPLAITGVSQLAFSSQADGSLLERDGQVVGSRLHRAVVRRPRVLPVAAVGGR